ncbi:ABC transporter ATP-binding protein [Cellulomonas pakistanensis]|uniref:Multidrug ABC transporter ATP-binding protein n=1 Tax=Cellulomonas pakistanensis TaxID=992287 RepID=A0A919PCT1_9CELL|nr:ABC transporter ATP-binding protein [Cellulomonas pakistanensis]GIG37306.1 multidrug ABC transporter ATP-binding protein [Cellulomonas pakistanensis]
MQEAPVIHAEHLRKSYGRTVAVADVSLTVRRGEIVGVLGRNGAGKTTTVEMIGGLRERDGGTVRVLGLDPGGSAHDRAALRERVGLQLQESALPARITVREAVVEYACFYDDPADPDELLRDLGLADKAGTQCRALSGGQKQRLSIALALVGNPELAVLDELTTGLDPQARRDTWDVVERVRRRGVTIVLVTHFMEEAERLCDRVVLVDAGRVVAEGTPAEVAARVGAEQTLAFHPSAPVDPAALRALDGVGSVEVAPDGVVTLRGTGNVVQEVMVALAAAGVRPDDLRVHRSTLEDAFVTLTGAPAADEAAPAPSDARVEA